MIDTDGHKDYFNDSLFQMPIHLIGCGGVGSHVATGLVRMGVGQHKSPIHLYDSDDFQPHNLANQAVDASAIGEFKTEALKQKLLRINRELIIHSSMEHVTKESVAPLEGVVLLHLDEMFDRGEIIEHLLENNRLVECVIETRMDAEVGMSHCFDPNNKKHMDRWWELYHTDEEAEDTAGCGGPQSIISAIYGTTMIALKQFEWFAKTRTTHGMKNRVYYDFEYATAKYEIWPT